ncbi:cytochrome c3 family protein [Neobacillus muris]|uniref:cytochrome c3 family protein n=1 Tax=Neobacillus muris TaxID=2941334 RepID=UPI00203B4090|nr:cytochrome c3 family protein [Neobacillus muris]
MILVITTSFSIPIVDVFAVGETESLTVTSPSENEQIHSKDVVIAGNYSSDVAKEDLVFTADENGTAISGSSWTIDDTSSPKTWSLSTQSLSDGVHTLTIKMKKNSTGEELAQSSISFTIDTAQLSVIQDISITSPESGTQLNTKDIEITGTYVTDASANNLLFTAKENGENLSDSAANVSDWIINTNSTTKTWTFKINALALEVGTHTITIEMKDTTAGTVTEDSIDFSILLKRPYVTEAKILLADRTEQQVGEDFTHVPLDAIIKVIIADDQPMEQFKQKMDDNQSLTPIIVSRPGQEVIKGITEVNQLDLDPTDGKYYYEILFTAAQDELKLNKTYTVTLDQDLVVDDSESPVFSKKFQLTTGTNVDWDDMDENTKDSSNPHGHYQLNTNMCASCHTTHVDSPYQKDVKAQMTTSREGGNYLIDFNEQLNQSASENYCTACHDGTLNAPVTSGISATYHHDNPSDYGKNSTNKLKDATTCTSCHNPHMEWSKENSNLLKDHYIYQHNGEDLNLSVANDPDQNKLTAVKIDSLDTHCGKCHIDNLVYDKDAQKKVSIFDTNSFPGVEYSALAYKKSLTATSEITAKEITDTDAPNTVQDYSLCLQCHNNNNNQKNGATDIEKYYTKSAAESGHFLALPDGQALQADGSNLNGSIPCSECHETHGSTNIKMLKTQLGHENPQDFTAATGSWDASKEKDFCMKCHDGTTATSIYGVVGQTVDANHDLDPTDTSKTKHLACSECHGGSSKSFMEAAHAPTKLSNP